MTALVLPRGSAGINEFAIDDSWTAEWEDAPWEGSRTLLVTGPVVERVAAGTRAERLHAVEAWTRAVLQHADGEGSVVLAAVERPPRDVDEVRLLAAGRRLPAADLVAAATHRADDPLELVLEGLPPVVREFAEALTGALEPGVPTSWITRSTAAQDVVASLVRGLAAPAGLGPADAAALRDASRASLEQVVAAGVVVTGRRDLLLWPLPPVDGAIPLDVAVEAAGELLRGQVERGDDVAGDVGEADRLEALLDERRAELDRLERTRPGLASLPVRRLLRRRGAGR